MLISNYKPLCKVSLPYQGRQKYMHNFDIASPIMAKGYEDYLEPVMQLCRAAGAVSGLAHMTVDEKIIQAGMSQRRPKPHVDGCFMPKMMSWGHGGSGGWAHSCNNISLDKFRRMPIIVAASVVGCRAWRGVFEGEPTSVGDCSHIRLGVGDVFPANVGYLLSPDCIHESMIQEKTVARTFLRIALPVEFSYE